MKNGLIHGSPLKAILLFALPVYLDSCSPRLTACAIR